MRGARLYWQSGHLWPPNYPTTLGHLNNDVEEEEDGDGDDDGGEADGLRMIRMSEDDCDAYHTPFGEKKTDHIVHVGQKRLLLYQICLLK